jgi:hypothetical protein
MQLSEAGAMGGAAPEFIQLKSGTQGYKTDWNNLALSIGGAWRPNAQNGFLRRLLGRPGPSRDQGWLVGRVQRQGMERLVVGSGNEASFAANPGPTLSLNRSENTGLVPAGES